MAKEKLELPSNVDAEISVLGACMVDGDAVKFVDLEESDFWDDSHQLIFRAIKKCGEASNEITVAHELNKMGKLLEIGGVAYLSGLVARSFSPRHIEHYTKIVKDCSFNRRLISTAQQIGVIGYKNGEPSDSLSKTMGLVANLGKTLKDDSVLLPHDRAEKAMKYYESIRRQSPGIATGMKVFDEKTGGLLRGEFCILAARGGMGKTTLALKLARVMGEKLNGLFISLEMSAQAVTNKDIASITGKKAKVISRGNYSDDTMGIINMAVGRLSEINLSVAEGNRDTASLRRLIDKYANTYGLDFVFVDYLQKFTDKFGGNQNERTGYISNQLSQIPRDYGIPLVVLSQLSRAPDKRDDKRPELSDLRDSGSIEQDADMVLFLYRESYYNHENAGQKPKIEQTELIVSKDRLRGTYGSINLDWDVEKEDYIL